MLIIYAEKVSFSLLFNVFQKDTAAGVHVFLEDTSANGTFVNGEKVGKITALDKQKILA